MPVALPIRAGTLTMPVLRRIYEQPCALALASEDRERIGASASLVETIIAADEAALPVYVYRNVVAGNRPSTTVSRLKTTHAQLIGPGLIRVSYSVRLEPPTSSAGGWAYTVDSCQPSDEPRTGFGLPGHHQCGSRAMTGAPHSYHW